MKTLEHYLALNYHNTITKDEDGDYIAEVQELAGCIADGETPSDALANLREAMKSWIESRMDAGLNVPEPRSSDEYSGKVLLRMPKSLHRRLAKQAEVEGVSMNQHLVSLLADASSRCEQEGWRAVEGQFSVPVKATIVNTVGVRQTWPVSQDQFGGVYVLNSSGFESESFCQRLAQSISGQGAATFSRRQTDYVGLADTSDLA